MNLKGLIGGDCRSRILDIGCGDGQFLRELRRRGFECVAGHEIPGGDLSDLEGMGIELYRDMDCSSVPSGAFEVITMLDVAEHVKDPVALFRQCGRILKKDGYLYFHTPVVTKFDRMIDGIAASPVLGKLCRYWQRGRTSIFHLQNYTDRSIRLALSGSGFGNIRIVKRNELSWPVHRYVRVYLCDKHGLPRVLGRILAPIFYPFLATGIFNANKGIVTAQKQS